MSRKRLLVVVLSLLVLGLVAGLVISACGTTEETTTTAATGGTETTAGAAEGDPITVGVINSMTGVNVLTGEEQKWAQEKCAADWNAKGGIKLSDGKMHKIVLKFEDDQSSDKGASAAMEKLIKSEGIKVVLSSNTTPYNQAAATVAEQNQAYFHINTSWIDMPNSKGEGPSFIGGMNLKWSSDVFELAAEAGKVAVGGAQNFENPADAPKKFAVMTENNPDGVGFGDGTVAGLKAAGYEVVSYEKFVEGQKDFSSIILKFKESGVEGIVCLISPADGITFVKQLKEQNWAPKYMFGYKGFWPVDFYKALGSDANYVCFDGFWSETLPYPGAKELGAAFTADHDGATSVSIGLSYAASQILYTAIERAGVFEPAAIRDQVFGKSFPGTTMGDISYTYYVGKEGYPDNPGIAHIPFLGFQWMEGMKRVVLTPTDVATGKTALFVPWDQR